MNSVPRILALAAFLSLSAGCGSGTTPPADTGNQDTSVPDTVVDTRTGATDVSDTGNGYDVQPDSAGTDVADSTVVDVPTDTVVEDYGQVSCFFNSECDPGSFCLATACGNGGSCEPVPTECAPADAMAEPVCACDGTFYETECFAHMAGTRAGTDADCGSATSCFSETDCGGNEYCRFDGCLDETGSCSFRPWDCPKVFIPVCGCDGQAYGNQCLAAAAGAGLDKTGARCERTACTADADCGEAGFCFKMTCNEAAEGVCETVPLACAELDAAVCGCDGTTYGNECLAKTASISVDATAAACSASVVCRYNADCGVSEFCLKPTCDTGRGQCATRPTACPTDGEAVCGCDGTSYLSACHANRAGTSVAGKGSCK